MAELGAVPGLSFGRGHRAGAEARSGHEGSIGNRDYNVSGRQFEDDPRGAWPCDAVVRATSLYSVDPSRGDRDDDAAMRIGGTAPGWRVHS